MANPYIGLYADNPTADKTDGTLISSDRTGTNPLSVTLDASKNETSEAIPVAVRCAEGYKTTGDTVISFTGTTASKWSVCATADGTYDASLTISDSIGTTNKLFYVKATSSADETPANDASTQIKLSTKIAAAS